MATRKKRFVGKFLYTFASGKQMIDRNRYKTLKSAQNYAKAHNKYEKSKQGKIVAVHTRKK